MAGCERCALKRRIREREKREKKRKKGEKWGSKSFFFLEEATYSQLSLAKKR